MAGGQRSAAERGPVAIGRRSVGRPTISPESPQARGSRAGIDVLATIGDPVRRFRATSSRAEAGGRSGKPLGAGPQGRGRTFGTSPPVPGRRSPSGQSPKWSSPTIRRQSATTAKTSLTRQSGGGCRAQRDIRTRWRRFTSGRPRLRRQSAPCRYAAGCDCAAHSRCHSRRRIRRGSRSQSRWP